MLSGRGAGPAGSGAVTLTYNGVQLAPAVDGKPAVHGLHVDVDRVDAETEVSCRLFFAAAGEQEGQDLLLAGREAHRGRVRADSPARHGMAALRGTHKAIYEKRGQRLEGLGTGMAASQAAAGLTKCRGSSARNLFSWNATPRHPLISLTDQRRHHATPVDHL